MATHSQVYERIHVMPAEDMTYPRNSARWIMVTDRGESRFPQAVSREEFPFLVFICGNVPLSNGDPYTFCRTLPEARLLAETEASFFKEFHVC